MKFILLIIKVTLVCILLPLKAQSTELTAQEYEVHKINNNVYILSKVWNENTKINLGVVIGDDGILLISSMMKSNAASLEAEIKKLSNKPIKYVLNIAADTFHHHANEYFASRGATIISHQDLMYQKAYTQVTFKDQISLPMGEEVVTAYYTPAHDLGQLIIHLENSNVVFMGDAFRNDWLMFLGQHGISGQLSGLDFAISLADKNTKIVPGNRGNKVFSNIPGVQKARKTMLDFSEFVGKLYLRGLNIDDIAQHESIHQMVKPLEGYEGSKSYLKDWVAEIIETEYTSAYPLTLAQLENYVGFYQLDANSSIEVILENSKLYAREKGKFSIELIPLSTTRFDFKSWTQDDHLEFILSSSGSVKSLLPVISKESWNNNYFKPGERVKL